MDPKNRSKFARVTCIVDEQHKRRIQQLHVSPVLFQTLPMNAALTASWRQLQLTSTPSTVHFVHPWKLIHNP
jgi:hypothetical protein